MIIYKLATTTNGLQFAPKAKTMLQDDLEKIYEVMFSWEHAFIYKLSQD